MKYRHSTILATEDVDEKGTKVISIDIAQPISWIDIKFKVTRASDGMSAGGPANILKIELVDGSLPLVSLTGYQCQALNYYNHPGFQIGHGQELNQNAEEEHYRLDFGRWDWDDVLALLPDKFTNLTLKISFDEDLSDTGVSVNEMEIWAAIFDEKVISPVGFLAAVEHHAFTCGSDNSYEPVKLPDDLVIRQILVRAYQDGYEPWVIIKEARFDEGGLARIPWEYTNLENYYRRMKSLWKPIIYRFQAKASTTGAVLYVPQTDYWATLILQTQSNNEVPYCSTTSLKGGKATLKADSDVAVFGIVEGYLPWHCYQFPMGDPKDIDDWYDPLGKKPRLRLRAGSQGTSGEGQVILEQFRRY